MGTGDFTNGSVGWTDVADVYAETFALLCAGTFADVLAGGDIYKASAIPRRVLDVGTHLISACFSLSGRSRS